MLLDFRVSTEPQEAALDEGGSGGASVPTGTTDRGTGDTAPPSKDSKDLLGWSGYAFVAVLNRCSLIDRSAFPLIKRPNQKLVNACWHFGMFINSFVSCSTALLTGLRFSRLSKCVGRGSVHSHSPE